LLPEPGRLSTSIAVWWRSAIQAARANPNPDRCARGSQWRTLLPWIDRGCGTPTP
jgi:hypothetical protein